MKCNELGNPVEYGEIYTSGEEKYRSVNIDGGSTEMIQKEIYHLEEKGIISQDAEIALEIQEILNYNPDELCKLTEKLCRTHGVKLKLFLKGFSQRSYDRLRAGGFEENLKRAEEVMEGIRKSQVDCEIEIVYLLYQFNMCEVHAAAAFVRERKIGFYCRFAAFEDLEMKKKYLALEMPVGDLIRYSEGYFFTYLDELENGEETSYETFRQEKAIQIDGQGNAVLEWYEKEPEKRPICSFSDKRELDEYYKENFRAASEEPYAGKVWLWGQCENKNRNELFRV